MKHRQPPLNVFTAQCSVNMPGWLPARGASDQTLTIGYSVKVGCRLCLLLALATSALVGCSSSNKGTQNPQDSVWQSTGVASRLKTMDRMGSTIYATNFEWWDSTGAPHQLHDYYGKPVIVFFWGSWCKDCMGDLAALETLATKYRDSGLVVIGITELETGKTNDILSQLSTFCSSHGIHFQQVIGNSELASAYGGIYQYPTTITISREDKVLETLANVQGAQALEAAVRRTIHYVPPK